MDLKLKGRRALITGASKGIGAGIARGLAAEGVNLVLIARTAADLEATATDIRSTHKIDVATLALDVSKSGAAERLARDYPDIDILVNNAGDLPHGPIDVIDEARWRAGWELKVYGYINITRTFYAQMKARGKGVIVNIVGTEGELLDARYICGATGNATLMAFTLAMGRSSAKDGLRVVGINPGPVVTDRLINYLKRIAIARRSDPDKWRELMNLMPFQRAATVEEIAAATAFLASDLSAYTTGAILTIDGGFKTTEFWGETDH